MSEIEQQLEALYLTEQEYDAVETNLENGRNDRIVELLGLELYGRFQEINAEFDDLLKQAMSDRERVVSELQSKIKDGTLQNGSTVKAAHYMAVFTQPKPAWDNGKLEGYALVHPEILECRTEKPPYVAIRKVK